MKPASLQQGSYVTTLQETAEETYIDDWCISSAVLYHRHPDEVEEDICGETGVVEHDVNDANDANDRQCWNCEATCSDEIWFIHRLYQL